MRPYGKYLLLILCLVLLASYGYKVADVPFIRLDDGSLFQIAETFALKGYLGSTMMETGHHESLNIHIHPPLYYLASGLVMKLGGADLLQARLVPLVSALLVIALSAWLFRPDNLPLFTLLFLSTPLFFILARSIRPEMFALAVILSALCSFRLYQQGRQPLLLLLSGVLCGAALLTQAYALFALIYLSLLILMERTESIKRLALLGAGFVLPLLPFLWWISRDFSSFYYYAFVLRHADSGLLVGNILQRYSYFFTRPESLATTLLFLALLILLPDRPRLLRQTFADYLLPLLCFFAVFLFIPVLNKYYYLMLLPFIYSLALYGLQQRPGFAFKTVLIVYLICNLAALGFYWHKYKDYNYNNYIATLKSHLPRPGNFSVLGSSSLYPGLRAYRYYCYANPSIINPRRSYPELRAWLKELGVKYVIYQEFEERLYADLNNLNSFLKHDCRLIATVHDPYYGSEGVKKNNYIKIYSAF